MYWQSTPDPKEGLSPDQLPVFGTRQIWKALSASWPTNRDSAIRPIVAYLWRMEVFLVIYPHCCFVICGFRNRFQWLICAFMPNIAIQTTDSEI